MPELGRRLISLTALSALHSASITDSNSSGNKVGSKLVTSLVDLSPVRLLSSARRNIKETSHVNSHANMPWLIQPETAQSAPT